MTVQLVTSAAAGPVRVGVPDVVGLTQAQAEARLGDFRVNVSSVEVPGTQGTVYSQVPEAPRLVARNSQVTIFVITNPPSTPDVLGRLDALDAAVAQLGTAIETAAAARQSAVLDKLKGLSDQVSAIGSAPPPTSTTGSSSSGAASAAKAK
jgi:beta-lactam-binding protein with PASTA domain